MSATKTWSASFALRGAGGEPVDFARTVLSHGVADLLPNTIAEDGSSLETVLPAGGKAWLVRLTPGPRARPGTARVSAADTPSASVRAALLTQIKHMLRLDEDLSGFYTAAAADSSLAWVTRGAGRMLRSPTVFEDLVKTICTTNCTWSATVRMVSALVGELGMPAEGGLGLPVEGGLGLPVEGGLPERRAFPTPEAMAAADDAFYRDVARAGYRGPYLRTIACAVAGGQLDLEALNDDGLDDAFVAEQLLALPGVGPYAAAHMMMLLGRYTRLILDSWTRPTYRRLSGRPRITDKGIERAFRRYREFAGLAFWLTLTESWVAQSASEAGA